ncbi:hypothetical protein ACFW05_18335, partial [Streptomyces albogriseolus]
MAGADHRFGPGVRVVAVVVPVAGGVGRRVGLRACRFRVTRSGVRRPRVRALGALAPRRPRVLVRAPPARGGGGGRRP